MNQQEETEGTEGGREPALRDAIETITRVRSSARFCSPPLPAPYTIRILSDEDVPSSVRSAIFIVTPTPNARPSSFGSGMNGILHPTALQRWGRQREPMPLRWSLADPVASVAINMPLQKELFASPRLPRHRVQDAYKEQASLLWRFFRGALIHPAALSPIGRSIRSKRCQPLIPRGIKSFAPASVF